MRCSPVMPSMETSKRDLLPTRFFRRRPSRAEAR